MHYKLCGKLPEKVNLACSGGVDSIVALHFLRKKLSKIIYVDHNTNNREATTTIRKMQQLYAPQAELVIRKINSIQPIGISKEEFWRNERYKILDEYQDYPVVVAHNLDDCVEEYIMCTMVRMKLQDPVIPYQRNNIIRPFRLWPKKFINSYAIARNLEWYEDVSNLDTSYKRNFIRKFVVPNILHINRGIYSSVAKMITKVDSNVGC